MMILYLLNASLIWLLSLLFFDLFLKKETFHSANRLYLNATLLLGLLLPLFSFADNHTATMMTEPVKKVNSFKSSVVNVTTVESGNYTWGISETLWLIYFVGVFIMLAVVVKEVIGIMQLYKNGTKEKYSDYTLVETHLPHSPFSFGSKLFLKSKESYGEEQLQMILEHELNHTSKKHLLDKLFFAMVKMALWFHPLMYVYYFRLMMIHEYEADTTVRKNVQQYGSFLIEQSLIRSHTLVTHSFNHSPIKNRIIMLTKNKSSRIRLFKYAFMIPMLLVFLVCCTKEVKSLHHNERKQNGNKITFKGNEFELSKEVVDSIPVEDPLTGEIALMKVTRTSYPIKMNGNKIYGWLESGESEANTLPILKTDEGNVGLYIYQKLKNDFDKLKDGEYQIYFNHLIIDEKGNLAYYDQPELINMNKGKTFVVNDKGILTEQERKKTKDQGEMNTALKTTIEDKITGLMDGDMKFIPAQAGGKNVVGLLQSAVKFSVKSHRAQFITS